ncbi:MAG: hypothetical protein Q4F00_09455 [bacterium]|nr:hypothetical protein [bacterium]
MNSVELFYEIFRMRYNVETIKRSFADRYSLCLLGCEEDCARMREWMGDYSLSSGIHPEKNLCIAPIPEDEDEAYRYRNMEAIVCHLGAEPWPLEEFAELVECMPIGVPIVYICEPTVWEGEFEAYEAANLPEVVCLRRGNEQKQFAALLFNKFQRLGFRLARDYQNLRDVCIDGLIVQASNRMALVAAASSITVNVPLLGQMLGLLASPVETLAITAEQLRLVLYIGALYGRPIDFFDRVNELWCVVGGGWGWRTLARQLVGYVPGVGALAKAGVAWAGTFAVGELSRRFYELGEEMPVNIREVVSNTAKRKVTRAIKMKFKNGEAETAVADMLKAQDSAEVLPIHLEKDSAVKAFFDDEPSDSAAKVSEPDSSAAVPVAAGAAKVSEPDSSAADKSADAADSDDEDTLSEEDCLRVEYDLSEAETAPEPIISASSRAGA